MPTHWEPVDVLSEWFDDDEWIVVVEFNKRTGEYRVNAVLVDVIDNTDDVR